MRYYIDSNVIVSLIKSEIGRGFRLMYPAVERLLAKIRREGHTALISVLCIKEIKRATLLSEEDILQFFKGINFEKLIPNEQIVELGMEVNRKYGIHFPDARHLAFASFYGADILVTWNKKDFIAAKDIVSVSSPDELL